MSRTASLLIASTLSISLAPIHSAPREFDGLAATVNGRVITKSEVEEQVKHTREMIILTVPPGPTRNKQLRDLEENALNSLIERELILAEFKKLGGRIKDEIIEDDINKIIRGEQFGGDREKFLVELNKSGMTLKRFKDLRRKILSVEMMRSREAGGIQIVTPQQLQAAYEKHGDNFREESFIRLRTITIPRITADENITAEDQRKLIESIRKKVLAGEDFAQLAKTYSQDSVADKGGDRGTIGESSIELRRDLKDAAFKLSSGQTSQVIEDPYAFYLLKVENKKLGAKRPITDPEVRETVQRLALMDLRKEANERWIARLKKDASIRRFDGKKITKVPAPEAEVQRATPALPPTVASTTPIETEAPKEEKRSVIDRLRIFKRD